MRRIKMFYIIFSIGFIFLSCEKDDKNILYGEEFRSHTTLIVNNYHQWYGHSSYKENAIFEAYGDFASYEDYFSTSLPWEKYEVTSASLPDSLFDDSFEMLNDYYRETFKYDSVKPGTYYFKSFNAYHHEKLVEFNEEFEFNVSSPLDSLEVVNVITKRYYIKSFNLKEIHIYLNEPIGRSEDKVNVKFHKIYPSGYAGPEPTTYFEDKVAIDRFPYQKTISVKINEFNSWWFDPHFYLSVSGSGVRENYEIKIFDLLNLNKRFTDSLVYFDNNNVIKYKLIGDWSTE